MIKPKIYNPLINESKYAQVTIHSNGVNINDDNKAIIIIIPLPIIIIKYTDNKLFE